MKNPKSATNKSNGVCTEYKLPSYVESFIKQYEGLRIFDVRVPVPYYRNVKRSHSDLRSLVGKGSPDEIALETRIIAQLKGVDLQKMGKEQIRQFMSEHGLGIDCSGFVAQVLDYWIHHAHAGSLLSNLDYPYRNLLSHIKVRLRPISNISANILTSDKNTDRVHLNEVMPGDLIRTKGVKRGDHVLLVSKVLKKGHKVVEIEYVNSNEQYGDQNGVRRGRIEITSPDEPLETQNWKDWDSKANKCWTLEGMKNNADDNGLRRLKFFDKLRNDIISEECHSNLRKK